MRVAVEECVTGVVAAPGHEMADYVAELRLAAVSRT